MYAININCTTYKFNHFQAVFYFLPSSGWAQAQLKANLALILIQPPTHSCSFPNLKSIHMSSIDSVNSMMIQNGRQCNDDCIIIISIAWKCVRRAYFSKKKNVGMEMKNSSTLINNETDPTNSASARLPFLPSSGLT